MKASVAAIAASAAFGGLVSLDRTACGQFLISRPLPSSALLGLALGCPAAGIAVGAVYELLFLQSLPVGAHIPLHPLYPALTAVTLLGSGALGPPSGMNVPVAIVLSLPTVLADRMVEDLWRGSNEQLFTRAAAMLRLGRPEAATRMHLYAVLRCWILNSGALFLCCAGLAFLLSRVLGAYAREGAIVSATALSLFFLGSAGVASSRLKGRSWLLFAAGLGAGALTAGWGRW